MSHLNNNTKQVGRPKKNFTVKPIPKVVTDINDAQITTKTFIVYFLEYDIMPNSDDWFDAIQIDSEIKCGSIVSKTKTNTNFFKNCFSCVVYDEFLNKVNIKICKNGTFQLTGCKHWKSCSFCVVKLLKYSRVSKVKLIIRPVMCNIKFYIGKQININNALVFFNEEYNHPFFAYKINKSPALNIKSPIEQQDFENINMHVIDYDAKRSSTALHHMTIKNYIEQYVVSTKDLVKMKKPRFNSIMLFRSGNCIISGINKESMVLIFNKFLDLVNSMEMQRSAA